MSNRKNFFFRQRMNQQDLDSAFADLERADWGIVSEVMGNGFLVDGSLSPATVEESVVPDLKVRINRLLGYDQLGRRLDNALSGYQGGVNLGAPPPQSLNMAVDENVALTEVAAPGNEKILSIFVEFDRNEYDPRTDGNALPVFFEQAESVQFNIVQSAEAPVGTAVAPPLRTDQLLLADVTIIFDQVAILNADIDQARREVFTFGLLHGQSHTENGDDPIPNSTSINGGLLSAVDKTRLDGLPEDSADVSALFNTQAKAFQPANFSAPSATTLDVTGLMVGKNPGGSPSVEGVVTVAPNNRAQIKDTDFDDLLDGSGNKVYGRITEAASVWTLSFYSFFGGSEVAYNASPVSGSPFQWFVQETYSLENLPTYDPSFSIPSDQVAGEVPDATTSSKGKVELALSDEVAANVVVQGNDARIAHVIYQRLKTTLSSKIDISSAVIPIDATIPQSSEGIQVASRTITPGLAGRRLIVRCYVLFSTNSDRDAAIAIFSDKSANAIAIGSTRAIAGGAGCNFIYAEAEYTALDTSVHTFQFRIGFNSTVGNAWVNARDDGSGTQVYGIGPMQSWIEVREETP